MWKPAEFITQAAYEALLEEVETTPKPGLVDLNNTGAHTDLTVDLFYRSALAIKPMFLRIAKLSLTWEESLPHLFSGIRTIGVEGERQMFEATNGVNTHKGALFSLGLLVGASAYAWQHHQSMEPAHICSLVSMMTKTTLQQELLSLKQGSPATHGEKLFCLKGQRGIRGEVMDGFPTITAHVLPLFPSCRNPLSQHDKLRILLSLMAHLQDTNILSRGGEKALQFIQETAQTLLLEQETQALQSRLLEFDQACIQRHLSSGGAADLLAASLFLHRMHISEYPA